MGILDLAKADAEKFVSDPDGFAVSAIFTSPDDDTATVSVLHTKHHMGVSPETGALINSRQAHITVAERLLSIENYPVRNSSGDVAIKKHKVDVKDSTGIVKKYFIMECYPDETLGLLTCLLEDRIDG